MSESFHLYVASNAQLFVQLKSCLLKAPIATILMSKDAIAFNAVARQAAAQLFKPAKEEVHKIGHRKLSLSALKTQSHVAAKQLRLR